MQRKIGLNQNDPELSTSHTRQRSLGGLFSAEEKESCISISLSFLEHEVHNQDL